jgi:hypothetical protein
LEWDRNGFLVWGKKKRLSGAEKAREFAIIRLNHLQHNTVVHRPAMRSAHPGDRTGRPTEGTEEINDMEILNAQCNIVSNLEVYARLTKLKAEHKTEGRRGYYPHLQ